VSAIRAALDKLYWYVDKYQDAGTPQVPDDSTEDGRILIAARAELARVEKAPTVRVYVLAENARAELARVEKALEDVADTIQRWENEGRSSREARLTAIATLRAARAQGGAL